VCGTESSPKKNYSEVEETPQSLHPRLNKRDSKKQRLTQWVIS